jgi:hypothetical protein
MSNVTLWCCRGCDCSVYGVWPELWAVSPYGDGPRNFCPDCQTDGTMHESEVDAIADMDLTSAELARYPKEHPIHELEVEAEQQRKKFPRWP